MRSACISNIAVQVPLYFHEIEMNLIYEKSNGIVLTLSVFQQFSLTVQELIHVLAHGYLNKNKEFLIIEIINKTGIRN